jgi:hypothetical protein
MRNGSKKFLASLLISLGLALVLLFAGTQSARANDFQPDEEPTPNGTPAPAATPTPQATSSPSGGGGEMGSGLTNILYQLEFPAETISKALAKVFRGAADAQNETLVEQTAAWAQAIGEILQAPGAGDYARTAQSSWPVAAALAPALFLMRIAIYNWNRLTGEEDSAGRAAGDILTALVLAVLCGWFLDLIVRLGWWMTGAAMGEAGDLAISFVQNMDVTQLYANLGQMALDSMFWYLIFMGVELGAVLAIAGMLLAFISAQAGLFLLAVLGPSVAVASALPQMRWLRALWLKAVTVIAVLPLVAGGIFKASLYMGNVFEWGGILAVFIRLMWLWGTVGAMLSLAGILGKLTISTTTDAIGQTMKAVSSIAATAALAGAGAGIGAAAAGAGGASPAAGNAAAGATTPPTLPGATPAVGGTAASGSPAAGPVGSGLESAGAHLQNARGLNTASGWLNAFGLHGPAQFARTLAGGESLAAQEAELQSRMSSFGGEKATDDLGFKVDLSVRSRALEAYQGRPESFSRDYGRVAKLFDDHQKNAAAFLSTEPEYAAAMARVYAGARAEIDRAPDPLAELAWRAGVPHDVIGPP